MGIGEILMGFAPILFSGAVIGGVLSYLTPAIIKKLKGSFNNGKLWSFYMRYQKEPKVFARTQPQLNAFFEEKGYASCECDYCKWLCTKTKTESKTESEANS